MRLGSLEVDTGGGAALWQQAAKSGHKQIPPFVLGTYSLSKQNFQHSLTVCVNPDSVVFLTDGRDNISAI